MQQINLVIAGTEILVALRFKGAKSGLKLSPQNCTLAIRTLANLLSLLRPGSKVVRLASTLANAS